jgi:hypothetical protein
MLEQMKKTHENLFEKFSNGGSLSKATPFRRVIVLQWKVNDNFLIFFNIVHINTYMNYVKILFL